MQLINHKSIKIKRLYFSLLAIIIMSFVIVQSCSTEEEESVAHRYYVSVGLLFYSNSNSDSFTFASSEKNYSKSFLDTGEIIKLEGCTFY